jgi:hypothetical protein
VYFATKELQSRNINLKPGEAFPLQDKTSIRMLGSAFGCPDALNMPWNELPYVTSVDVRNPSLAEKIKTLKMTHRDAQKMAQEAAQGKV